MKKLLLILPPLMLIAYTQFPPTQKEQWQEIEEDWLQIKEMVLEAEPNLYHTLDNFDYFIRERESIALRSTVDAICNVAFEHVKEEDKRAFIRAFEKKVLDLDTTFDTMRVKFRCYI